jgi:hypothetical protein
LTGVLALAEYHPLNLPESPAALSVPGKGMRRMNVKNLGAILSFEGETESKI